jgi:hypothetical protein
MIGDTATVKKLVSHGCEDRLRRLELGREAGGERDRSEQ